MKKRLLSLAICVLMALTVIPFGATAETTKTYTSGKYEYIILKDKTVEITSYTGSETNVTIPSKLNNKKVTSIGYEAFYYNTKMESVVIPSTVTNIGAYAFEDCSNLVTVTMSNNVKNIEYGAFKYCYNLENINLPSKISVINKYVFSYCRSLVAITIPDAVKIIDESAFLCCNSLRNVKLPDTLEYIGSKALNNCKKLSVINLPNSVNHIGEKAIYGTAYYNDKSNRENGVLYIGSYLIDAIISADNADYTVKDGTKLIANGAFYDCDYLKSITFPESLTTIPFRACASCDILKTINVPDSVTYISSNAFADCVKLENINLGDNIERIGEFSFYNTGYYNQMSNWDNGVLYIDNYLISMKPSFIGNYTVKEGTIGIANSACSDCDCFKYYYDDDDEYYYYNVYDETDFNYSNAKWYGCIGLTGITIPESVKYIGSHAFDGCDAIVKVEFNEGLQVIGANAFLGCKGVDLVKIPQSVTKFGVNALDFSAVKVIAGYIDSAAENYAKENNVQFVNVVCSNGGEHTAVELGKTKSTCFTKGYTAHTKCSVCGEDLSFVKYTNKTKLKKSSFTLKSGKKSFKITYKKVKDAKGFQVKYKTGKSKWKTKTFNAKKKVTKTIKKLKKGKKYSVKIRAFAKFSGKKVYSNWTAAKKVTVK